MIGWHAGLHRGITIGGRVVTIGVASLREDDSPRWGVRWSPDRPTRLLPEEIALFDAFRARATADLLRALRSLPR